MDPDLYDRFFTRRLSPRRYEATAAADESVVLATAQFYTASPDGTGFTGWVVSQAEGGLRVRAARELRLYQRYPHSYPDIPDEAQPDVTPQVPSERREF
ncbi:MULTISPECIES: hypothetical protein [unclassified Streptomyces]|uniref:hypothetical protein n=1 Tax=unclassified Streptomyces TaxID=2593676 RepID=UPI00365AEA34